MQRPRFDVSLNLYEKFASSQLSDRCLTPSSSKRQHSTSFSSPEPLSDKQQAKKSDLVAKVSMGGGKGDRNNREEETPSWFTTFLDESRAIRSM